MSDAPAQAGALAEYLARVGGRDELACADAAEARRLAVALRQRGGSLVAVEQQAQRVVLVLTRQPARI